MSCSPQQNKPAENEPELLENSKLRYTPEDTIPDYSISTFDPIPPTFYDGYKLPGKIEAWPLFVSELDSADTTGWWALCHVGYDYSGEFELRSTRVVRDSSVNRYDYFDKTKLNKPRIEADSKLQPFFFFRGVDSLVAGPVITSFYERKLLIPGETISLIDWDSDGRFSLKVFGEMNYEPRINPSWYIPPQKYSIYYLWKDHIFIPLLYQESVESGERIYIDWAGDLNHDSIPDLILGITSGNGGRGYALFVSNIKIDKLGDIEYNIIKIAVKFFPAC